MIFIASDKEGARLKQVLNSKNDREPSFEQELEAAYRSESPVLAISLSGNSFQIAANKYYDNFPAISIKSPTDIDDGLDNHQVRLFEINAAMNEQQARRLFNYLQKSLAIKRVT